MLKNIFFLFFGLTISLHYSQDYKPLDTIDGKERNNFILNFKINNDVLIKDLKTKYTGKTGRKLAKVYTEFRDGFEKEIKERKFSFKSNFDVKIQNIIHELSKNNTTIPKNLKILIAKDNYPNAFCLGDGTFVVNMGLFSLMETEQQIAGVISHELAHEILKHNLKSYLRIVEEDINAKEEILELKNSPYNTSERAFNLFKKKAYRNKNEQRKKEIEADSLGYVIFKNSTYSKHEYINALENLQKFDSISPTEIKIETYKKYFSTPNQNFKEEWLKKEDFSTFTYSYKDKLDKDSLSTHPEIGTRIEVLKKNFPEINNTVNFDENDAKNFKSTRKIAFMEILPNFYQSEDYGLGIYTALQILQESDIEQDYMKYWLGVFFQKIYLARKEYALNRYLDRVDPQDKNKSYQQFLNFMWNLKLEEIKNIADYYTKKGS